MRLVEPVDTATLAGLRDPALLLLGFAAAPRRSELAALDVEDLHLDAARGLLVTIRRSKADQKQEGRRGRSPLRAGARPLCRPGAPALPRRRRHPPRARVPADAPRREPHRPAALRPVGRALSVKRRAKAAGVPPELLFGHSVRAGYATAAAAAGVEERKIANVTRHRNLPVLRRYIRAATAFDDVGKVL